MNKKKNSKRAVLTALSLLSASLQVSGSAAKETYPDADSDHAATSAAGTPARFAKMQSNQHKSQTPSSNSNVTGGTNKTKGSSTKSYRTGKAIKMQYR